jgi:O-acetyl-ADP-ribose deacetylase (regulator of RNase III)
MINYIKGNIFTSKHQTLVNTVNCHGIMGAGIALECRIRYPLMFDRYKELCDQRLMKPGKLYLFEGEDRWILNFPTKDHWKLPSKAEYLTSGLKKFVEIYKQKGITSVAFPLLGTQHGGMDGKEVVEIMKGYLDKLDIPVEIYEYDSKAEDDLMPRFRNAILSQTSLSLKKVTGINISKIEKLKDILDSERIGSMIQLFDQRGLGEATVTACYNYAMGPEIEKIQLNLF